MNRREFLLAFRSGFQKFRATIWFRITYLVLLGFIVAELFLFTSSALACLIVLLIPITVFIVPYWLGERKIRRFAGNGAVVFSIAILVAAAMSTQAVLAQGAAVPLRSFAGFQSSPGMALTNGTVDPYRGSPGQSFTFRVNLTTTASGDPNNFTVFLNLTTVEGFSISPGSHRLAYRPGPISAPDTKNGSWYEGNLTLGGAIYIYGYSVSDGRNWTVTVNDAGPVVASGWSFFGFFLYLIVVSGGLPIEFLFYLGIVFLWWYMARSRERMKAVTASAGAKASAEPAPKAEPETPKAGKAAAFTCTNCGADVGESDTKCPKCGATFED